MSDAPPLSIGEVLSVLQEEFPDVTISKIRFLESQGLVRPERNASGYRQFTDIDVQRLTWILRQQRDHFLPLKVIKKALERGVDIHDAGGGDQPTLWSAFADEAATAAAAEEAAAERESGDGPAHPSSGRIVDSAGPREAATTSQPVAGPPVGSVGSRRRHSTPADVVAALQEDPRQGRSPAAVPPAPRPPVRRPEPHGQGATAAPLTREELLSAADIPGALLDGLEQFGLVEPVRHAGEPAYREVDVEVARIAGVLAGHGVEARHLRIYKVSAEREAGFIEQLVTPLLKQRNPAARDRARELTAELSGLGARLHAAILSRDLGVDLTG